MKFHKYRHDLTTTELVRVMIIFVLDTTELVNLKYMILALIALALYYNANDNIVQGLV